MFTDYLPMLIAWALFGLIHSLTAAFWFKEWVYRQSAFLKRYYRLIYNGIALLTFIPIMTTLYAAPAVLIGTWNGSVLLGGLLMGLGISTGLAAFREYNLAEFIGWPMAKSSEHQDEFQQSGLLSYVRHPLYMGILIALVGLLVAQPDWKHLLFDLLAITYIRIGIYFEERKLVRTFGHQYRTYQQHVPMLFPRLPRT
ncbi:isoprenylcysteine carboxylmethyltransferase family protein [Spirosoma sp. SC4-14]|uniref:methyltransferase family protein n=1 Tax=Spirosoma sp. SC4-14 TaxID=3128900 RepID=UPI0030CB9C4C